MTGDVCGDRLERGYIISSSEAVRGSCLPDVGRDNRREWAQRGFERHLGAGGVKQPESGIERFAEASVVIIVDVPDVDDEADSEAAIPVAGMGAADVVAGQELAENGYHVVEDQFLVGRIDEGEQAVAPVGELVAALRAHS